MVTLASKCLLGGVLKAPKIMFFSAVDVEEMEHAKSSNKTEGFLCHIFNLTYKEENCR